MDVFDMAAAAIREIGGKQPGEKVQTAIERAARRSGLDYWRAFDIFYRKARRIEQHELDAIADALEQKRREAARNEFQDLKVRLAKLEARLAQTDADFHRDDIAGLGAALRLAGPGGHHGR